MKKITPFLCSAFLLAQLSYAQLTFQRVVGLDTYRQETGEAIVQTSTGGYMISGHTLDDASSLTDAMIVKTSPTGVPLWNKKYGTAAGFDEFVSSFRASDGSYYFAGTWENTTTYQDVYVVKTDSSGTTLWEKTYNMPSQEQAIEIRDGGAGNAIVVTDAGTVIKINSSGTIVWQKNYTNGGLNDVIMTSDGGYMIAGTGTIDGHGLLIKTDVNGNVTWAKSYGAAVGGEYGKQVVQALDGGYYFALTKDYIYPSDPDNNIVLIKTTSTGVISWCNAYSLSGENIDLFDMTLATDGSAVICGQGNPFTGVAVKVNASGVKQWDAKYGANMAMTADRTISVVQTTDGGFAYTGSSYSFGTATSEDDFYLVKADALGATGTCYRTTVGYSTLPQTFTATTVAQATTTGTFTTSTVTSSLAAVSTFTNIACAITTGPIHADFVANTTTVIQGGSVNFTDLSSNFPTGWSWSFTSGSPATSTIQNPTGIVYNSLGCFTVTLTASNGSSSDGETKTCYIHVVQDSSTSFQRSIGVDTMRQETGESIFQTSDGGYVISGNTFDDATSLSNAMIVRTSNSGSPSWHKEFGTTTGWDRFVSSFLASDGSYYFAGTRENTTTYQDVYVVKTDASGNTLWEKTYNMPSQEEAVEIRDGGAGNAIVVTDAGTVIKINSSGTIVWQKNYTNGGLNDVIMTSDGGYMIAGTGTIDGHGLLIKTDVNGNVTWAKSYGAAIGGEFGKQVIQALDGGYYFAMTKDYIYPSVADNNIVLLKTTSTGVLSWCNAYSLNGENIDLFDMTLATDGSVVICGQGNPFTGVAVKVNALGVKQWDAKYGADMAMTADRTISVVQTADGGYVYTGSSYSFGTANSEDDFYLVKTDVNGTTGGCYQTTVGYETLPQTFTATTVAQATTTGTFTTSTVTSALPPVYIFNHLVCAPPITTNIVEESSTTMNVFPNPANDEVTIEISGITKESNLEIYNSLGQKISEEKMFPSTTISTKHIDVSNYAKGIYIISLQSTGARVFKKLIVN